MYLAYFDESGDSGYRSTISKAFVLGCVLVRSDQWLPALDALKAFRTALRIEHGIPMDFELKGHHLGRGKALKRFGLTEAERRRIYHGALQVLNDTGYFRVFGVVIRKDLIKARGRIDPRIEGWVRAIERVQSFAVENESFATLMPDVGHAELIKRLVRRMRRHNDVQGKFGTGAVVDHKLLNIVEDVSDRISHESYFVQAADWVAYAAHRAYYPLRRCCDNKVWFQLGDCRVLDVSRLNDRGDELNGMVDWPKP
ncbi:MAG: DUF3800 domain-containing protein [Chrysiogenetes bacterium]|nr:DUF3800 domain-containing protein [Chrysiogenetes bacterium]